MTHSIPEGVPPNMSYRLNAVSSSHIVKVASIPASRVVMPLKVTFTDSELLHPVLVSVTVNVYVPSALASIEIVLSGPLIVPFVVVHK